MYLLRRCGVGWELLSTQKWFSQRMAAHVDRDTNNTCNPYLATLSAHQEE